MTLFQATPVSKILATASPWSYCTQLSLLWFNQETSLPAMTSYSTSDKSQHPVRSCPSDLICCSSTSPSLPRHIGLADGRSTFPSGPLPLFLLPGTFLPQNPHGLLHYSPSAPISLLFQLKGRFLSKTLPGNLQNFNSVSPFSA